MKLLDKRAIEALAKYKEEGLVKPGDTLFWQIANRYLQEAVQSIPTGEADDQQTAA